MKWSYSSCWSFKVCQRQWFYNNKYANFRSTKSPERRTAAYLKNTQSLSEWRGSIVDTVITKFIYREKKYKQNPSLDQYLEEAKKIYKEQFYFAKSKSWEKIKTKTEAGNAFCILTPFLNEDAFVKKDFDFIWEEIVKSLGNYFDNEEIMDLIEESTHFFPQHQLRAKRQGVTLIGVPDLILFYSNRPPIIIDWKVYRDSTFSHKQQLLTYASLLFQTTELDKFPDFKSKYDITDTILIEYQLLEDKVRRYSITENEVFDNNDFVDHSIYKMKKFNCQETPKALKPEDFIRTENPEQCEKCPYKSICWTLKSN